MQLAESIISPLQEAIVITSTSFLSTKDLVHSQYTNIEQNSKKQINDTSELNITRVAF